MQQTESSRNQHLVQLAIRGLSRDDAIELLALVDIALDTREGGPPRLDILAKVSPGKGRIEFNSLALLVARSARRLGQQVSATERASVVRTLLHLKERATAVLDQPPSPDTGQPADTQRPGTTGAAEKDLGIEAGIRQVYLDSVGRSPVQEELDIWKRNFGNGLPFHEFMLLMRRGPEAVKQAERTSIMHGCGDAECIQRAFELVLGRGAAAWELAHWLQRLESGATTRAHMLATLFHDAVEFHEKVVEAPPHDGLSCLVMGAGRHLSLDDWRKQAESFEQEPPPAPAARYHHRFHIRTEPRVLVSALCSLYRGGDFIEQFMDNITSQDSFDDYAELVIVDADSPEDEYQTIKRYLSRHRNIQYHRMKYRIGIYDAWNFAAQAAKGEYLTNTNLDDLRRHDSFALQAGVLDNLPFVDVTYQDLYYTFDPRLSFEEIAAFGHRTELPVVTPHNMIAFNSPHNAPMWRRRLHDELGWFDTRYKSAGDYEFWLRCLAAGKTFYKTNDPHVAYYQNPKGLSTRPDTRGISEAMEIHRTYCRKLVPEAMRLSSKEFAAGLGMDEASVKAKDRFSSTQKALRRAARNGKFAADREAAR